MKVPDLTEKEANKLIDDVYARLATNNDVNADHEIVSIAYRQGVDAARDDILTAIELILNYPGFEHDTSWQGSLDELQSYIFSILDLKEWYNSAL